MAVHNNVQSEARQTLQLPGFRQGCRITNGKRGPASSQQSPQRCAEAGAALLASLHSPGRYLAGQQSHSARAIAVLPAVDAASSIDSLLEGRTRRAYHSDRHNYG